MSSAHPEAHTFTNEDRAILRTLTVPIPSNEQKRIEILRQSKLTDENTVESGFSRFTSLATRLFDVSCLLSAQKLQFKALSSLNRCHMLPSPLLKLMLFTSNPKLALKLKR